MFASLTDLVTNSHVLVAVFASFLTWLVAHGVMSASIAAKIEAEVAKVTKAPAAVIAEVESLISTKTPANIPTSIEQLIQNFTASQANVNSAAAAIHAFNAQLAAAAAHAQALVAAHAVPAPPPVPAPTTPAA